MTREELRKKRQEIAQKNGYAGYDTRKYSPVKQNTTQEVTPAEPTINKVQNTISNTTQQNQPIQQNTSTWNNVQARIANQGVSKRSLSDERVAQANNNKLVNTIANSNVNNTQPIQAISKKEAKKQEKEGKKLLAELEYNKDKEDREKQYQKDLQNADTIGDKVIVGTAHALENVFQKPKALYDGVQLKDAVTIPVSTGIGIAAHTIEGVKSVGDAIANTSAYGVASVANITGHKEFSDRLVRAIKASQQETKETTDKINSLWDKNSLLGESGNQALNSAGQSSVFGALGEASEAYKAAGQLKKAKALKRMADGLTFTMGASGGFEEAYNKENTNGWEAILKATGGGAASYISENLFDWMGYGGNKLTKGLKEKIGKQFNSGLASGFAKLGFSAFGEGAEEIAEEVLNKKFVNALVNKITSENKYDTNIDVEDTVSNAVVAMLSVISTGAAPTTLNARYETQHTKNMEQIQNSSLNGNQKEALTQIADQYNLSEEDVKNAIQNTLDGKYNNYQETGENQNPTIQNNEVLNQEQQITQEEGKIAQNELSEEVQQKVMNMMKSMDKYNETRQEGQDFFDINNEETQQEVKAIQKLVEDRNINIVFDESKFDNTTDNAYYEYDKDGNIANIYLNPNSTSKKYVQNLAIHEVVHSFSGKQKANLMNDVMNYAKTLDGYNEAYQEIKEAYQKKYGDNVSEEVINEEVVANILGEKLGDKQFVNDLINGTYANQNKNWVQKLYDFVKNQINRFKGYKNQEQYWTHIKELFDDAYRNSEINKQNDKSYSIGGEVAKENYNKSNGNNTNLAKMYNQAVKMAQQKVSNEEIRKQTHWFQDKNGQWKFEFSDRDMRLKDFLKPNSQYKLGDILEHDILFELYPELKDYNVATRNINANGIHNGKKKLIKLNNKLLASNRNVEKTLIHEVQHAIQNTEGFENGTSTKKSKLNYYNNLGEIEASDVSRRFEEEKYNNNDLSQISPESSKQNPKHKSLDNYLQNRGMIDKIKDVAYNSIKEFFNKESENYSESFEEDLGENNGNDIRLVDGRRRHIDETRNSKQSSFNLPKNKIQNHKEDQLKIINETNPMWDDEHVGIRKVDDIQTFEECIKNAEEDGAFVWGDYSKEDAEKDLKKGKVTIYSSYPIKNGVFVSTSYQQAYEYAGHDASKVHSRTVNLDSVAWINGDEGQYAKVKPKVDENKAYQKMIDNAVNSLKATNKTNETDIYIKARQLASNELKKLVTDEDYDNYNRRIEEIEKDIINGLDSESNKNTKYSIETSNTDNNGNKLSKGQQDYFKDSKARNDNGELEVVYHGSNRAGFTEFNRNFNYYTNNKEVAQSYTGGTEIVDTKKLESVSDAKSWLKGINEDLYINENKVYDDGEEILSYSSPEEMLKNLKRDIQKEVGGTEAGGIYEGYVKITKPVTIDANNDKWSMIAIDNIKIDGVKDVEKFLKDYGSSVWKEKGKLRTTTNDIVVAVQDAIEDGTLDVDGIIIKNIYDEGGYGSATPTEIGTDYITFNSNQFKAQDNTNPTNNKDIRYSNDMTGAWNSFIEKYFKNEGEGTSIQDLKKKLPVKKYTIKDYESILDNSKNIPQEDKKALISDLNSIELNKKSLEDFKQYVTDLDNSYSEYNAEQEKIRFNNKNYKDESRAELLRQKKKEFNKNMDYDDSVVAELDEIIPRNRNGKRTVSQWKNMAKELGSRIANMTPEQIEDIAVKSYYDLEPSKAITRYDNKEKTNVGFEQLYANDWVNSVYEGVRENRQFSIDTGDNINISNTSIEEDIAAFREETKKVGEIVSVEKQIEEINNTPPGENPPPDTRDRIVDKKSLPKRQKGDLKRDFVKQFVNKDVAVDELAKKTGNKNLTWKNDRRHIAFGEAQYSIGVKQTNVYGEIVGDSLVEIYNNAEKANIPQKDFDEYLLHRTNIERSKYEKGLFGESITAKDSERIVETYEKKYSKIKDFGQQISNYNDENLKILRDGGFISQDLYTNLRKIYENYVPAVTEIVEDKVFEESDNVGFQQLKRAVGSNEKILSPKESIAEQTLKYRQAYRNNEVLKEIYRTTKSDVKELYNQGEILDPTQAQLEIDHAVGYDDLKKKYTATIFENGNYKIFEISKDIYNAFKPNGAIQWVENRPIVNYVLSKTGKASQGFKALTTGKNILYALKNMVRDLNDAPINSTTNIGNYYAHWLKAYKELASNGKYYQEYTRAGGGANTYFDYEKGMLPTKQSIPKKFLNKVEQINEVVETAPRLAEYILTRERGGTIDEALYNAAEVTTNFKRGGELTKAMDKYAVPFLNASVQGLDKQIRNLTGQNGVKGYANLVINSFVAGILPSVINHMLLDDDDEYEKLPDYLKDNYYLIPSNDKQQNFIRIPKGRVSGMLGATAVRTIRRIEGDSEAFDNYFGEVIWNNIGVNNPFTDNLLAPLVNASDNFAWYGGNIYSESKYKDKLPVEIQDEKTDKFSIWVGEIIHNILPEKMYKKYANKPFIRVITTPKLLNYALDQYSGFIGDFTLPMLTPYAENNAIIDQFTTSSVLKDKTVSEFYDILGNTYYNSEYATDTDKLTYKYLTEVSKETGALYGEKASIQNDSNLSPKEKREQTYEIQKQINEKMAEAVNAVKGLKINDNTATFDGVEYYKDADDSWKKVSEDDKIEGLNTSTYAEYKNEISKANSKKKETEGKTLTDKEKMTILNNGTYTDEEKDLIYSGSLGKDDDSYKAFRYISDTNSIEDYLNYKTTTFESDKIDDGTLNGKSVTKGEGSKKNKIVSYLEESNFTPLEKLYLYGNTYKLDKNERVTFENLLNETNITPEQKKEIYLNLNGVVEMQDGSIKWK